MRHTIEGMNDKPPLATCGCAKDQDDDCKDKQ